MTIHDAPVRLKLSTHGGVLLEFDRTAIHPPFHIWSTLGGQYAVSCWEEGWRTDSDPKQLFIPPQNSVSEAYMTFIEMARSRTYQSAAVPDTGVSEKLVNTRLQKHSLGDYIWDAIMAGSGLGPRIMHHNILVALATWRHPLDDYACPHELDEIHDEVWKEKLTIQKYQKPEVMSLLEHLKASLRGANYTKKLDLNEEAIAELAVAIEPWMVHYAQEPRERLQSIVSGTTLPQDQQDWLVNCLAELIAPHEGREIKANIKCETKSAGGAVGTVMLPVVRVEREDDGSITVVTNHWPTREL